MKYLFLFMLLILLGVTHFNLLCNGLNNVEVVYGLYKVEETLVFCFIFMYTSLPYLKGKKYILQMN